MKKEIISLAEDLCEIAPRTLEREKRAARLLKDRLEAQDHQVTSQKYDVVYPEFEEYWLRADGKDVKCLPSGLESGRITEKHIIDNWNISGRKFESENINFNPYCDELSKPTFYEAPALTISRGDVQEVVEASEVEGKLKIDWRQFQAENIIIGNSEDPTHVFLTHYDSWWGGFTDNALAVATLIKLANEANLDNACIVFTGSEEISHEDQYWCYGYREFEKSYHTMMEEAELLVVDTLGRGDPIMTEEFLEEAFLLNDDKLMNSAKLLTTHPVNWRDIYHSPLDIRKNATDIEEAIEFLRSKFKRRDLL